MALTLPKQMTYQIKRYRVQSNLFTLTQTNNGWVAQSEHGSTPTLKSEQEAVDAYQFGLVLTASSAEYNHGTITVGRLRADAVSEKTARRRLFRMARNHNQAVDCRRWFETIHYDSHGRSLIENARGFYVPGRRCAVKTLEKAWELYA